MIPNRLVLDTNVCLDLFVFRDPRWAVLATALQAGTVEAVTREDCRTEWRLVLEYRRFALTAAQRAECSAAFDGLIRCIAPCAADDALPSVAVHLPCCSDADDQKFLETARDSGAGILITKDKALLKLAGKCRRSGLFSIMKPDAWVQAQADPADATPIPAPTR